MQIMIKRDDVKVGLKFVLPVSEIKRYSDGIRYLVQTGVYGLSSLSFLSLEKPGEVFCIESIGRGYVCCKVADLKDIVVCTETLTKTGFIHGEISTEGLMKGWKEEILKWFPAERRSESIVCGSPKGETEQVSHPSHYAWLKDLCGVEPIEICRQFDFSVGNALKYLMRKGKVDGDKTEKEKRIEDLKKAVFYLQDEIMMLEAGMK